MTTKKLFIFSYKTLKTLHILRYFSFLLVLAVASMAQAQCPNLVWSDEFNGTELDINKWEPQIGDGCNYGICQWGNNELQFYKAENAVVSGGTLKIIIKQEKNRRYNYTSARLRTKGLGDFTYGRFEARMKLLQGRGLWPAFWMLSSNEPRGGWPQSGEIDIMEFLGQEPQKVFGTVHYGDPYPNNKYQGKDFFLYRDETFADDFHVFAVEWEPGEIRWYVDDVLYSTKTAADIEADGAVWPFDPDASNPDPNQMHLLLNVAVGGNLPGPPDETTPIPNQVEIDWVHVYDNSAFKRSISGDRLVPYQSSGHIYTLNNAPTDAVINWSVPTGASIVSGQGTDTLTVNWGGTGGDVVADTTDGCGMPASYSIDVTVESDLVKEFSFENFDDPANAALGTATGTLSVVGNPDQSGINGSSNSAQYDRNPAEQYDAIFYSTASIPDASLYESGTKKFYMDVLTSAPVGTQVLVQLEDSSQAGPSNYPTGRHSRYRGTVTRNGEWERIVFDYLDSPDSSTPDSAVDQIILLFAPDSFTGDTYFWDNFDSYVVQGTASNMPPTAAFSYATTDLTADFDGSGSSDSDGSISSWEWEFGDGSPVGSGVSVSHPYSIPGDYSVTLTVTDDDGATGSTTQVVSVSGAVGDPTTLHVLSVVTGTENAGGGNKRGTATITVHDDLEAPVDNATVTAIFSGTINETVSGQTGPDGTVTLKTGGVARGGVTVNVCIYNVTLTGLPYDPGQNDPNVITCN